MTPEPSVTESAVPKPSRISAPAAEEEPVQEAPELPKAKVHGKNAVVDDLPEQKGPSTPADAVNAALDKARGAAATVAAAATPTAAAAASGPEPGDQEGVYKRWPIARTVIEGKGRACCAARPLSAGAVVYQARPWVAVVSDPFMRSVCAHCFACTADDGDNEGPPPDLPFSCEHCSACGYCSADCKAKAYPLHAKECESVAKVVRMTAGKADSRGARMLIRALAQRLLDLESGDSEILKKRGQNLPTFVDVMELEDHLNDLPPAKQKEFLSIAAGVGGLPIGQGVGKVELVRLVATLRCNSQAVVDVANQRRGDLLIAPADFNHSCDPNCNVAFYGSTVQVRTLREVDPDEELTIQYTDLYLHRADRKDKLALSHCFDCSCTRCADSADLQALDRRVQGFRCGVQRCDGLVPPPLDGGSDSDKGCWTCVKCGSSHHHRKDALQRSAAEAMVTYGTALESSRRGDFEAARMLLEGLIAKHSPQLFWQHSALYNTHHALFSACNALEDTEDAASAAASALACLRATYPPFHPVR